VPTLGTVPRIDADEPSGVGAHGSSEGERIGLIPGQADRQTGRITHEVEL
jgi:hypothetical protein